MVPGEDGELVGVSGLIVQGLHDTQLAGLVVDVQLPGVVEPQVDGHRVGELGTASTVRVRRRHLQDTTQAWLEFAIDLYLSTFECFKKKYNVSAVDLHIQHCVQYSRCIKLSQLKLKHHCMRISS